MTDARLLPDHAALVDGSAIAPEVAAARGYRSVTTRAELKRLGFSDRQARVPALLIPVHDVHGELALYQLRPDEPRIDKQGKTVKYETPGGSHMVLDVPPVARGMLDDPSIPLFVTEGIRKADAAVSVGLCCIALLGVWNWRGSNEKGGTVALADWESIALRERIVHIVFDSDVMTNPTVDAALERLAGFLSKRGARVRFVYLPAGPAATKVGLDDFLAAGHRLDDLLALATDVRRHPLGDGAADSPPTRSAAAGSVPAIPLADALEGVERLLRRFVVLKRQEAYTTVTLWVAHTHAMEAAEATPYLAIASPEKQSGKTRLLELLRHLTHACTGILITPTASTLFRTLDAAQGATLLLDELDAVFRDRSDRYEEVRAVINAGHRRGATVPRNVPGPKNTWQTKQFDVFGPKALAGIGRLPDTIVDRSIPIAMVRRKRTETVERWRERVGRPEAEAIRDTLRASLGATPPAPIADVPESLPDRAADAWEPLLAIADAAGGAWPARARQAASVLQASPEEDGSLGIRLLADVRLAFESRGCDRIFTTDLIEALVADAEGPWASFRTPFTAHRLGTLLAPYEIRSKQLRIGERNLKGYERDSFVDSWERFLPASPSLIGTKQRNMSHERGFDVSLRYPPEPELVREWMDQPVERDYPRSAWDPDHDDHLGTIVQ